ncbi:MAG: DUF1592 domain-containing protein [Acidobacteria bacterium]|nr:DUF1592 domain-containing protein [Acidobacteriota bacterium]
MKLSFPSVVIALCLVAVPGGRAAEPAAFVGEVQPLLESYCYSCHGPALQLANLRLDDVPDDLVENRRAAEIWGNVLNKLRRGEMPPKGAPHPEAAERDQAIAVLRAAVERAAEQRRSTDGRTVLRRLNRTEYQRTMTDLLGYEMDYARDIPPDGMSRDGFHNNALSLRMTATQLEYYLEAARAAMERVIVTEPEPMEIFDRTFTATNLDQWLLREEQPAKNLISRTDAFLGHIDPCYPEEGRFVVTVTAGAELKPGKGPPIMQVSVGFRPDTEIMFRTAGTFELDSEEARTFTVTGYMENYPKPVRGQSKYPGLVVRVTNVYDDGTPKPKLQTREKENGKKESYYPEEPDYPKVRVDKVTFTGPIYDEYPPAHHKRILFESQLRESDETEYARQVLKRFMTRAWRRPPEDWAVESYVSFFRAQQEAFPVFEERIRETLAMVLISPEFLYLMEPDSQAKRPLDAWETASRLSYLLWSTMPDERLFALAESGELLEPDTLGAEVERMLGDERAWAFTDEFLGSWLYLDAMDRVAIHPEYYPGFNDNLKRQIREETRQFFMELLRHDLSAVNLIDSDFLMLNETMARHYGIEGVWGSAFRRVPLERTSPRGGLLTQASLLLGNSTGEDSHPIKRAVWVRKRLLDDPPPPPPANVPELDSESPEMAGLSVREQLRAHRKDAACASCHVDIDPWGVAFEHFDAIGQWRNEIRKLKPRPEPEAEGEGAEAKKKDKDKEPPPPEFDLLPVDTHETLPDGTEIAGVDDLRGYLLGKRRDDFARTIVTKLLAYSLGRSLELADEKEVDGLTARFVENDLKLRTLLEEVVKSDLFRTK